MVIVEKMNISDLKRLLEVIPDGLPIDYYDYQTIFKILVKSASNEELSNLKREMREKP